MFRPAGEKEFRLIQQSGFKRFPTRLPEQHTFRPVLSKKYAAEIATKRKPTDNNPGSRSYVLEFEVDDNYISWFEVKTAGADYRQELCIPAEQMDEFNSHITGLISVVGVYGNRSAIL